MPRLPAGSLMSFLADVPDPRRAMGKRRPLVAMLTHACCAMLRGRRGYAAIARWGRDQPIELMRRIGYRRTPSSRGSSRPLPPRLDAAALEAALSRWAAHLLGEPAVGELRAMAIDGKTSRGSLTPLDAAAHLLAAMDQRTGGVLGQRRVDAKADEHKAALEPLRGLVLSGRVVTGDAMFRPRDSSRQVVEAGGPHLWEVDDDQPSLEAAFESAFEPARSPPRPASPGRGA